MNIMLEENVEDYYEIMYAEANRLKNGFEVHKPDNYLNKFFNLFCGKR
jgi:hypothetical protein